MLLKLQRAISRSVNRMMVLVLSNSKILFHTLNVESVPDCRCISRDLSQETLISTDPRFLLIYFLNGHFNRFHENRSL